MERVTVGVNGTVQSVGFRPFVYRTAVDLGLAGTVRNLGDAGVRIELEGSTEAIERFLDALETEAPPLARVERVDVTRESGTDSSFDTFEILESGGGGGGGGTIPPDTATCAACLADVRDSDSRYHGYWATSCVDCGPRYTVVEALPYDRPTSSMAAFPMCADCRTEYEDPADRRYHAQTIACPECGPSLVYVDRTVLGETTPGSEASTRGRDPFPEVSHTHTRDRRGPLEDGEATATAAAVIGDGGILAVKGIGGAHLACDATDAQAVARLRERTGRPAKPFAVMAGDVDSVESFAAPTAVERTELLAPGRPILLVDRINGDLAPTVAPGLHTVGVMLPYSGLHHLLFDHLGGPVVLTSANLPGRPMATTNATIVDELADVADGFLLHDRRIVVRCDDSVARVVDGRLRLLRRSRGFAPTPIPVSGSGGTAVLALGPELDTTAAVLGDGDCYLTQHVGDVDDPETFAYLRESVAHLLDVTGLDHPPVVAHDAHPEFQTTAYARELETDERTPVTDRVTVQHHHAHAASVLGEHDRERAIAITVDGVGYGPDETVWGGEVLDATRAGFERVGGLAPVPMPGGDRATRYPARMVAGFLAHLGDEALRERLDATVTFPGGVDERDLVCQQLEAGVNTPTTTSAGRFLDAVSALLGVCGERTYEGEPAMRLEATAVDGTPLDLSPRLERHDGRQVVDTPSLFERLVEFVEDGHDSVDVAATAQEVLALGLADVAVAAAERRNRETVALTGGVAYNEHVSTRIHERVSDAGLSFIRNERVPCGDGGIAFGQAVVAAARLAR